jgi:hypothetical protein
MDAMLSHNMLGFLIKAAFQCCMRTSTRSKGIETARYVAKMEAGTALTSTQR